MAEGLELNAGEKLHHAEQFLEKVLSAKTIADPFGGQQIQIPLEKVKIATDTMSLPDGNIQQSLTFKIEGTPDSELSQKAVLAAAENVLGQIPTLAASFNFGADDNGKPRPSAHNWRDDRTMAIKFDLPAGVEPADVVKEILAMAQGAAVSADSGNPALDKFKTAKVVSLGSGAQEWVENTPESQLTRA